MQQLGCDPSVWKQMFKKIWEHIFGHILDTWFGATSLEEVNQKDMRKVWEGTYDLVFNGGVPFHGGRLNNTEADWQRMMQFLGRHFE